MILSKLAVVNGSTSAMASAFFTPKDQEIIKAYPIEISDEVRNCLPLENFDQYISSAASSQGMCFKLGGWLF